MKRCRFFCCCVLCPSSLSCSSLAYETFLSIIPTICLADQWKIFVLHTDGKFWGAGGANSAGTIRVPRLGGAVLALQQALRRNTGLSSQPQGTAVPLFAPGELRTNHTHAGLMLRCLLRTQATFLPVSLLRKLHDVHLVVSQRNYLYYFRSATEGTERYAWTGAVTLSPSSYTHTPSKVRQILFIPRLHPGSYALARLSQGNTTTPETIA